MNTTSQNATPTPEQAAQQIKDAAAATEAGAAASVASSLQTLAFVGQARGSRLDRTAADAAAQYGPTSTQAQAAKAAADSAKLLAGRIAAAQQQAATPAPTVDPNAWVLHGRVYDSALNPLAQHSVFLADTQKIYQSAYGFSYTDSSGYFLITAPAEAAGTKPPTDLYLQIVDPKASPVYSSASAFSPTVGTATYQTVTLPPKEPPLGDPPADVRATALPPAGKKGKGS
jgi:hypothetical protein